MEKSLYIQGLYVRGRGGEEAEGIFNFQFYWIIITNIAYIFLLCSWLFLYILHVLLRRRFIFCYLGILYVCIYLLIFVHLFHTKSGVLKPPIFMFLFSWLFPLSFVFKRSLCYLVLKYPQLLYFHCKTKKICCKVFFTGSHNAFWLDFTLWDIRISCFLVFSICLMNLHFPFIFSPFELLCLKWVSYIEHGVRFCFIRQFEIIFNINSGILSYFVYTVLYFCIYFSILCACFAF